MASSATDARKVAVRRGVPLPYPSSLDIVRVLRMDWRMVYYSELAAFAEQAASGRFRSCAHGCGE
jgi:hypothetical protein